MADIDILVDSTQVKTAKQEMLELSNSFNAAYKSAGTFMQAFARASAEQAKMANYIRGVAKANQDLINANLNVTNSYKSAEQSALAMVEGLRAQEAQALKTAKANQDLINAQLGVNGGRATDSGATFSAMSAEIDRLANQYNQVYAASNLYEKELTSLNRAAQLGVISTKQYEAALESLNLEYQQFANSSQGAYLANNRFSQSVNSTRGGLNNFGVITQQAGYQVGDFLVQVQSGTNWMVAFGQQATQMVGFLPLLSGAFGLSTTALVGLSAGLGVAIPLITAIGAAFIRTKEATDSQADSTKELKSEIESLDQALKNYLKTREAIALGITPDQLTAVESLQQAQQAFDLATVAAEKAKEAASAALSSGVYGYIAQANFDSYVATENLNKALADQEAAYNRILQIKQRMAPLFTDEINNLAYSHQLEMARLKFGEDDLRYKNLAAEADRRSFVERVRALDIEKSMQDALIKNYDSFKAQEKAVQDTKDQAQKLRDLMDAWNGATFQATLNFNVTGLPDWLPDVRNKLEAIQGGFDPNNIPTPKPALHDIDFGLPEVKSGGGGGGGGYAANMDDRIQNELEALYSYLDMVKETETEAYAQRQETLQEALDKKIITITEYQDLEKALLEKHNQEVANLEAQAQEKKLGEAANFFGAMASVAQAGGEKYVKVAKVLGATEALINTYIAQSQVLRDPTLGFFGKMAAYASIGAAGLGLVSALSSGGTSKGASGSGNGGRRSSSVGKTSSATTTPQTVYVSGIDPNALFTGEMLINLFDNFYKENDNRGKVFVVNK